MTTTAPSRDTTAEQARLAEANAPAEDVSNIAAGPAD
jgi:hypothetical protein